MGQTIKNLPAMQKTQEMQVWSLGQEDYLEKGMAAHSSILVWRTPWTEEPGGLQSMGHKELDTTEQLTLTLFTFFLSLTLKVILSSNQIIFLIFALGSTKLDHTPSSKAVNAAWCFKQHWGCWEHKTAKLKFCLFSEIVKEKKIAFTRGFTNLLDNENQSVQFSHSVVSDSLRSHWLQHARLPCPSPTPGACSDSCPSSWWCHLTIYR